MFYSFINDEFLRFLCFSWICIIIALLIFVLARVVGIDNPDSEKLSAYECGFDPYEDARKMFDVRFYLVAILFIIFDLEAVFFFPWCVSISFLTDDGFLVMIDFLCELVIGYTYAWQVGALDWE